MRVGVALLLLAGLISSAAAQAPSAYDQGAADRAAWEGWFSANNGSFHEGAAWWAEHRSDRVPTACINGKGHSDPTWLSGCTAAQQKLTPSDRRRKTDASYRRGWNGPIAAPSNNLSPGSGGSVAAGPSRGDSGGSSVQGGTSGSPGAVPWWFLVVLISVALAVAILNRVGKRATEPRERLSPVLAAATDEPNGKREPEREFYSSVAGVSRNNANGSSRQEIIAAFAFEGGKLTLQPEDDNPADKDAIALFLVGRQIGYLRSRVASDVRAWIVDGYEVCVTISELTGGCAEKPNFGLNILIQVFRSGDEAMA